MDLGCANRVRVRKSLCITILRTRFSVADFGGFFKNRVRKIASRTQNQVELGAIYVRDSRFAYAIFAGILLSVICVH